MDGIPEIDGWIEGTCPACHGRVQENVDGDTVHARTGEAECPPVTYTVFYTADGGPESQGGVESAPYRRYGDAVDMRDAVRAIFDVGAVILTYYH
jgi:hypothetical protein